MVMTAIPAQLSASARAAQQEREALEGIAQQERMKSLGQSIVPPEPVRMVTAIPVGMGTDGPLVYVSLESPAEGEPLPDEVVPGLAALRASGMTEAEIAAYVAEMTGQPVPPPSSPAAAVLEQVEGGTAALGKATPVLGVVRAATLAPRGVTPRPMTADEMAEASRAVGAAKTRLSEAEEALQQAQAERAAAVEALEAARHRVAEGFAALMT
jgi:hypothetical protein